LVKIATAEEVDEFCRDRFVVAGTGSRNLDGVSHFDPPLLYAMLDLAPKNPVIVSGMSRGWDTLIAINAICAGYDLIACVPNPGYAEYYWKGEMAKWNIIIEHASLIEYVMPTLMGTNGKPGGANFDRNQRMVDLADHFFVYNRNTPGTQDCVRRLKKANRSFLEFEAILHGGYRTADP